MTYRLVPTTSEDEAWLERLRRAAYRDFVVATWGVWDEDRLDEHRIDRAVLALLYLGLHDGTRAWKGFDREDHDAAVVAPDRAVRCRAEDRRRLEGAHDEVEWFQARGLRIIRSVDEIPDARRGDAE